MQCHALKHAAEEEIGYKSSGQHNAKKDGRAASSSSSAPNWA
jgi:hypothetical protein